MSDFLPLLKPNYNSTLIVKVILKTGLVELAIISQLVHLITRQQDILKGIWARKFRSTPSELLRGL